MAAVQFTSADRDEQGFIKAPAPRSLADLLPKPEAIRRDTKRQPWTRAEIATLSAVALCAAFVLICAWATPRAHTVPPVPHQTIVPTAAPIPTAAPVAMLPAFAAPDGVQLGEIEVTRAITPIAHYGADWIQANVVGSGLIWLRAADFPALAIVGDDLAPHRPAAPVAPAAPVYVAAPEPPPAPLQCAEVGIPGQMVSVCGDGDLDALAKAKWIATYGGNIGTVGHPTPQIKDTP